jgi:hypothetical protein
VNTPRRSREASASVNCSSHAAGSQVRGRGVCNTTETATGMGRAKLTLAHARTECASMRAKGWIETGLTSLQAAERAVSPLLEAGASSHLTHLWAPLPRSQSGSHSRTIDARLVMESRSGCGVAYDGLVVGAVECWAEGVGSRRNGRGSMQGGRTRG